MPVISFFSSSSVTSLLKMAPSMIWLRNSIGLKWMEGTQDEEPVDCFGSDTEKDVVFAELPLIMNILLDMSTQKFKPTHFRALVHGWSSILGP